MYKCSSDELFRVMKEIARNVYERRKPVTVWEYKKFLIEEADMYLFLRNKETEHQLLEEKAEGAATWWWKNVFHKETNPKDLLFEELKSDDGTSPQGAAALLRVLSRFGALLLDTETTGLSSSDRIIELSIIDMSDGRCLYHSNFNPQEPLKSVITEITGLSDGDLKKAPVFDRKIAFEINKVTEGRTLCAWNSSFDMRMLKSEFTRAGSHFKYENDYDLMPLFARAMSTGRSRIKLADAMKIMGIEGNQEHRSLSDCLDTKAVIDKVLERWSA